MPADITAAVDGLVDAAPGASDTLNELAAALGDDPNFAATVTSQIATKADASALINNAAAWSSGAVGDGCHHIDTGTDALVIRTNGGQISASFLAMLEAYQARRARRCSTRTSE